MQNRILNKNINLDSSTIKQFWKERSKIRELKGVLLGEQKDNVSQELRNDKENRLLHNFLNFSQKLNVLDIGCGIARWATNLKDLIASYHGIDQCEEYINENSDIFGNDNYKFFCMSAANINTAILLPKYDLIIVTGVSVYLNDDETSSMLNILNMLGGNFYFQESISLGKSRLTLKDFYSDNLNSYYSAIYRTKDEYNDFIKKYLTNFKVRNEGILLDNKTGARAETNAYYWFLENDRK